MTGSSEEFQTDADRQRRTTLLLVGAVVIALALVVGLIYWSQHSSRTVSGTALAADARSSSTVPSRSSTRPAPTRSSTPSSSKPSPDSDGGLHFSVTKVEKNVRTLGTGPLAQQAQGQFVVVHVSVENIGSTEAVFSTFGQTLTDDKGTQVNPDPLAALLGDASAAFLVLEPGDTAKDLKVIFDIPAVRSPKSITLHGGVGTDGVTLQLP